MFRIKKREKWNDVYHKKVVFITEQMQKEEIRGDVPDFNIKTVKIAFPFCFYFKNTSEKRNNVDGDRKRLLSAFLFKICPSERWMAGDFMPQTALISAFSFSVPSLH